MARVSASRATHDVIAARWRAYVDADQTLSPLMREQLVKLVDDWRLAIERAVQVGGHLDAAIDPLDLADYPYPEAALGSGKRVSVRVEMLVDETGQVIGTRLREGDKSGLGFNEIALDTARIIRFQPATRDDVPGKMWTEMLFDFSE